MIDAIEMVQSLNKRGEGVLADGRIAPGALPGETIRFDGDAVVVVTPSSERATPFCRYYGACGGCAAQHMAPELYAGWKRQSLIAALAWAGVKAEVGPMIDAHGEGRRRATFHASAGASTPLSVGFMRMRAHEIIDIEHCPLFAPDMKDAAATAHAVAKILHGLGKPLDIQVTATLGGLDVDLRGSGPIGAIDTARLIAAAGRLDLARLANHGEILIERRAPRVAFGRALVVPPSGGFLQATVAGEQAMADAALAAVKGAGRVADLFCGAGAFALRLAESHEVFAADADAPAIAALRRASGETPGLRAVEAVARDLFRRPLQPDELARFDAVLFDPPRAGALAQAQALASSLVPAVVAISCNVESFARDARALLDGGFRIETITPLDQFRFSPHVEIVAVFRRARAKKRRPGVLG